VTNCGPMGPARRLAVRLSVMAASWSASLSCSEVSAERRLLPEPGKSSHSVLANTTAAGTSGQGWRGHQGTSGSARTTHPGHGRGSRAGRVVALAAEPPIKVNPAVVATARRWPRPRAAGPARRSGPGLPGT